MANDVLSRLARRVAAARDRVGQTADDEFGFRASRNLAELRKLQAAIGDLIDEETIRGRDQGASWAMLGTSKQQAQQRHAQALKKRALVKKG